MDITMMILSGVGTTIIAIGGILSWSVKISLPKLLDSFEQRNKALFDIYAKTCGSIDKITESISSFKEAVLGVEYRLSERISKEIDVAKDDIIEAVNDKKISDLTNKVEKLDSPSASGPKSNNLSSKRRRSYNDF